MAIRTDQCCTYSSLPYPRACPIDMLLSVRFSKEKKITCRHLFLFSSFSLCQSNPSPSGKPSTLALTTFIKLTSPLAYGSTNPKSSSHRSLESLLILRSRLALPCIINHLFPSLSVIEIPDLACTSGLFSPTTPDQQPLVVAFSSHHVFFSRP